MNLGFSSTAAMAKALGLTENMYWKRAQVGRVVSYFPEVWEMLKKGETHISHIALIAPKITEKNKDVILPAIKQKSEREVREILSTVTRDGKILAKEPELELRLKLTKSQMEKLDRAREVLSARGQVPSQEEVLLKAVEDLLEKRDPVRKAARAEQRKPKGPSAQKEAAQETSGPSGATRKDSSLKKEPKKGVINPAQKESSPSAQKGMRRAIHAAVKHELVRRSGGRCMYQAPDGSRCSSKSMLEVDHVHAHSLGGTDDIDNLRILCREHNMAAASALFGQQHMALFKRKRHTG